MTNIQILELLGFRVSEDNPMDSMPYIVYFTAQEDELDGRLYETFDKDTPIKDIIRGAMSSISWCAQYDMLEKFVYKYSKRFDEYVEDYIEDWDDKFGITK